MDITIKSRGKNFLVIPQSKDAHYFLQNETGAVPHQWSEDKKTFYLNKKDRDSYKFLNYLMDTEYDVVKED